MPIIKIKFAILKFKKHFPGHAWALIKSIGGVQCIILYYVIFISVFLMRYFLMHQFIYFKIRLHWVTIFCFICSIRDTLMMKRTIATRVEMIITMFQLMILFSYIISTRMILFLIKISTTPLKIHFKGFFKNISRRMWNCLKC